MFRCFRWVVSNNQPNKNANIDANTNSLLYYYDIIHKNKSCDNSCNFTEIDYYTTLSKTRSIQKKIPGRRGRMSFTTD